MTYDDDELKKRADVIASFEADQWPVAKRDVIRRLVRAVWLQGYRRGWSECKIAMFNEKTNNDNADND